MRRLIGAVCLGSLALAGCATTTRTEATYTASSEQQPGGAPYTGYAGYDRVGRVEQVRVVAYQTRGNPAAGAVAGGLIGGLLFGGWGWAPGLFGAASGALIGSAASSGYAESRAYEVLVRFDDGDSGVFTYRDYAPFRPGQRVVLTAGGLAPAGPGTQPAPRPQQPYQPQPYPQQPSQAPGQVPPEPEPEY